MSSAAAAAHGKNSSAMDNNPMPGSHSSKNIQSVVTQRKSSSHKGRRVDINALNQSSNGI